MATSLSRCADYVRTYHVNGLGGVRAVLHLSFHRRKETAETFSAKVCRELGGEFSAIIVPNDPRE